MDGAVERRVVVPLGVDLRRTNHELRIGGTDPAARMRGAVLWRAWHTPEGPVTTAEDATDPNEVRVVAWGPGAAWALETAPRRVGAHDTLDGFDAAAHPAVERAHRRLPHLRLAGTGLVADGLLRTVFGQKVTGVQHARAWARMVREHGAPAPGPAGLPAPRRPDGVPGLRTPPTARQVAGIPYETFHRWGVERRRAVLLTRACARIERMQEAVAMPPADAWRRVTAFDGIGPWTAAIILRMATGDPDLVEVGDYHLPDLVAWNLAGVARGDDARMLELLEPFRPHRGRALRLLELGGAGKPRFGPRLSPHLVEDL